MVNIRYELFNTLNKLINFKKNTSNNLVIYSSFAKLLPPNNFNKWDALYTIDSLVKEGYTIALPSFTFSFCKNKFYSEKTSASETGVLSDWVFQNFENSIRTEDPIYSFVVIGQNSHKYKNFNNQTSWGEGSIFEYFEKINAKILTLGCGLESITQFHRYEQITKVPYRYYKSFEGVAEYSSGNKKVKTKLFARDLNLNPKNNMNLIKDSIKKSNSFYETFLFRGNAKVIDTKDLANIIKEELLKNPYCLLENADKIRHKVSNKIEAKSQNKQLIALLGFNNNEIIINELKINLESLIPERAFEFYLPDYGQFIKEIIDPESKLNKIKTFIRIFSLNLMDIKNFINEDDINNFLNQYIDSILRIHSLHGGWSIVNLFFNNDFQISYNDIKKNIYQINKINTLLFEKLSDVKSLILVDPISTISNKNIQINDPSLWYLGRFPYSNQFSKEITFEWSKQILSIFEKKIRLIIVDLDNTIWGGVLGEDGISGITFSGEYPGNVFNDFQKELVKLRSMGIALAIASKNNLQLVKEAFKELKDMPLKWNMFSAKSIGWYEKVSGIKEISDKLNIGLYSILFIDDNAAEIEKVKKTFPEIKVLHLPKDPTQIINKLRNNPYLRSLNINKEDLIRLESINTLIQIKDLSQNKDELNKYLINLDIKVYFTNLSKSNINRAAQLCQKTNQFNSTTIRFTDTELLNLQKNKKKVIIIGHSSKDSNFENIGLMIIEENNSSLEATLKLYLLSCRVLGRGLEKECVKWLANFYLKKGYKNLNCELIKNEKNIPIHGIFKQIGFTKKNEITWKLLLKEEFPKSNQLKIYNKMF